MVHDAGGSTTQPGRSSAATGLRVLRHWMVTCRLRDDETRAAETAAWRGADDGGAPTTSGHAAQVADWACPVASVPLSARAGRTTRLHAPVMLLTLANATVTASLALADLCQRQRCTHWQGRRSQHAPERCVTERDMVGTRCAPGRRLRCRRGSSDRGSDGDARPDRRSRRRCRPRGAGGSRAIAGGYHDISAGHRRVSVTG